ncbi:MAG: MBL fold metallo-hydrolase [bacterium]|nr:MBL fold metallo-hydrolase [bacterium]
MIITYHGGHFIKIAQGDTVIGVNPFGKGSSHKPIRFGARIGIVSMNHPDMNGVENLSHGDKTPFVISGPGEYEVGGITVSGFLAPARPNPPAGGAGEPKLVGAKKLLNTIYTVEFEGIRLCFLGALSSPELSPELIEGIDEIDILFTPIGGGDLLSPADAEKISLALEAKLVVPLAWDEDSGKQLKLYLKEAGAEGTKPIDKLTLKKKDLEGKEGDVVILEPLTHA